MKINHHERELSYCFFSVCVLVACSKAGGNTDAEELNVIDQSDDVLPVITVTKPTAMQVYISGDSIIAEGKVTDDKKLYKGKVQIKNGTMVL